MKRGRLSCLARPRPRAMLPLTQLWENKSWSAQFTTTERASLVTLRMRSRKRRVRSRERRAGDRQRGGAGRRGGFGRGKGGGPGNPFPQKPPSRRRGGGAFFHQK